MGRVPPHLAGAVSCADQDRTGGSARGSGVLVCQIPHSNGGMAWQGDGVEGEASRFDPADSRWEVDFASSIHPGSERTQGFMVLRESIKRLVVLDSGGEVVDARYLVLDEGVDAGMKIDLPGHTVWVLENIRRSEESRIQSPATVTGQARRNWWLTRSPGAVTFRNGAIGDELFGL